MRACAVGVSGSSGFGFSGFKHGLKLLGLGFLGF